MAGAIKNPFDFEGGDLTIVVMYEGKRVTGKVSTSAMMLASPVWKKFICPPWNPLPATGEEGGTTGGSQNAQETSGVDVAAETVGIDGVGEETLSSRAAKKQRTSQASKPKELDFTEDNADAFLILLRIAHLQFSELPVEELSFDLLFQLATVSDKYDCIQLVIPWIPLWTFDPEIEMVGLEMLLFVAWAFRPEGEMWDQVPLRAVERLFIDEFGVHKFSGYSGEPYRVIDLEQMPPGVLERLLSKRQELLGDILDAAYTELSCIALMQCQYDDSKCRATRYGSLCLKLRDYGVWPPPQDTFTLCASIRVIKEGLTEFQRELVDSDDDHQFCYGDQYEGCLTLEDDISRLIDSATFDFDSLLTE
ncbi:hypothetical protein LARI1_G005613 [Lachnellula arida]|uniref:BTB domain-containing protein n=1 Tax=Lachnellula arida TaxID=1316785 RepID=A0A8T9B9V3_9HELO|nr:hypothetical protein LARI1_G005613 [Lachnellula arida]